MPSLSTRIRCFVVLVPLAAALGFAAPASALPGNPACDGPTVQPACDGLDQAQGEVAAAYLGPCTPQNDGAEKTIKTTTWRCDGNAGIWRII